MKYVKIYNEKMLCVGVADIEKNYDKDGYVKLYDKDMNMIGVVDVDDIPESGDNIPLVQVFDEDMNPAGIVTADNIRHSDGYLIKLQKYPDSTGAVSGGGRFIEGTEVTVVATPDSESDYSEFDGWYENGVLVSENASYTFTVEGAHTLVAKFLNPNTVITYTAYDELVDFNENGFGDAVITSHTFENGAGKIKFDRSVEEIGSSAFEECYDLTSVTIPNSVTSIGDNAFYDCSNLESVTIPNSVTSIGSSAFVNCSGLTSVTIPNSVTSIGEDAFKNCSSLTSITIPNSVASIGNEAFSGCYGLTSITVESRNTKFDSRNDCNAIIETANNKLIAGCKNTVIPNSVTSIGSSAFSFCRGLTSIDIPNSVTSISNNAFYRCFSLTSVTIPNSVTSIGKNTFNGCSNLDDVTCRATTPPTLGNFAFEGNASGRKIYVPAASVDTYKAASGWRTYAADIEAIPAPPVSLKTSGGQNVLCESKDGYTEVTFNHNSFNGKWNGYYGDDWVANLPSGKKHRFTFTFNSGVSSDLTLHFIVATDNYGDWNDGTKVVDEVIEAGATSFQYDVNNTSYKYVQLVNTGTSGAKLGVVSVTREEINV